MRSPVEDGHVTQPSGAYHSTGSMTPLDFQGTDYLQKASPGFSRFSPVLTPSSGSSSPYPNTPPFENNTMFLNEPLRYDDWFHNLEEACTSIQVNQHYPSIFPQDLTPPFPQHFTNCYTQACNNAEGRPALHKIQPEMVYTYPHNPLLTLSGIDACMASSQNENWNTAPLR